MANTSDECVRAAASGAGARFNHVHLIIRHPDYESIHLKVRGTATIATLKTFYAAALGFSGNTVKLFWNDSWLDNDDTVNMIGLYDEAEIDAVVQNNGESPQVEHAVAPQSLAPQQQVVSDARKIWLGGFQPEDSSYVDEDFIQQCFGLNLSRQITAVEQLRHSETNDLRDFCLVTFDSEQAAQRCLNTVNDKLIPGTYPPRKFCVNSYVPSERYNTGASEFCIYICNVDYRVDEDEVRRAFLRQQYDVTSVCLVREEGERFCRYGFVCFASEADIERAVNEMYDGVEIGRFEMRERVPDTAESHPVIMPTALNPPGLAGASGLLGSTSAGRRLDHPPRAAEMVTECCVCRERVIDCALYNCGHEVMCFVCAEHVKIHAKICPICRAPILDVLKIYRS